MSVSAKAVVLFDVIAVLIAVVTLGQLPIGPSVGAAAAVTILGHDSIAATVAAGILLTATGTATGLAFATWAGPDRVGDSTNRRHHRRTPPPRPRRRVSGAPRPLPTIRRSPT